MKNTSLDSPIKGECYWVVSDPNNYLPGQPVFLASLEYCEYMDNNIWLCDPGTEYEWNLTSPIYMECQYV